MKRIEELKSIEAVERERERARLKGRSWKNSRGITLLVLVITIVILIILSTVTISAVFGDGGLVEQARKTKEDATNMVAGGNGDMNELLQEYANVMSGDSEIENPNLNDIENPNQNEIVDPGTEPDEPDIPEDWNEDRVTAVESEDGKMIPVPVGYVGSEASGENAVIGGFVIYEGEEEVTDSNVATAKTSRNQFVWVPVEDINDIAKLTSGYDTAGRLNYQGKLYNFSSSGATEMSGYGQGTTAYREPDIVTKYDNDTSNMSVLGLASGNALKQQLQLDFNEIVESVEKYGGFYIGRYETGDISRTAVKEPKVVKGQSTMPFATWYYIYASTRLLNANSNVKTTMIWGNMWDRTLIWLAETNEESQGKNGKSYAEIVNSVTWGNYATSVGGTGARQNSGYSEAWKANNIYDMAGNACDWTIEANGADYRMLRGGDYKSDTTTGFSAHRYNYQPNDYYMNLAFGSRAALYIVP